MAKTLFKNSTVNTSDDLPNVGDKAPEFILAKSDFTPVKLSDFSGKKVILNVFPSIETSVCSASIMQFNRRATEMEDVIILGISMDLPLAHQRFCDSMKISKVMMLSDFKDKSFGQDYGLTLIDGPWSGLLARAVFVLNQKHEIVYVELVPEIAQEPNYDNALAAVKSLK